MTIPVRLSILSVLLLGFLLNGCASTGKSTAAADGTASKTSAVKNPSTDSNATKTLGTSAGSSLSTGAGAPEKLASAELAAVDSVTFNRKSDASTNNGPVFKNAAPPSSYPTVNKKDPWESMNRSIFWFNEKLDDNLLRPVAKSYRYVMPDPLEVAIRNVFSNMNEIPVTFNNILQLKFNNALQSSGRLLVNTTAGLGGILDVASKLGLEKQNEDFGQTLGFYGVSPGPYLVLPLLGPSSARDLGGLPIDLATDPVAVGSWFVAPFIGPVVSATRFADMRARLLENDKTLEDASLDKYEFMREAYLQRRQHLVHDGNPPKSNEDEETE